VAVKATVVAALLALVACGDSVGGPTTLDSSIGDTGSPGDTAFPDGPRSPDVSTPPPDPTGEAISAGPEAASTDIGEEPGLFGSGDPRSCWDGADNDGNFERDCDDPGCDTVPACALGSGTRCTPEVAIGVDPAACGAAPATPTCLGITGMEFGSPAPWVAADRLHPGGADIDSGMVLGDLLDPSTRRITLTGAFALPTCPGGELCVETVSFGITTTTRFDTMTRIAATAALKLSGARSEVQLVIGGALVERWAFVPTSPEWTLDLRPTGEVVVMNGTDALLRSTFTPPTSASAVVYGRNANRAAMEPDGAGLTRLSVASELCNIPDAWSSRGPLTFTAPGGASYVPSAPRGPSLRRGGDGVLHLAFEIPGAGGQSRIVVAAEDGGMGRAFVLEHAETAEILSAADVEAGLTRIGDPELYWDADTSLWHLFFTGEVGDVGRIGHASGMDLMSLSFTGWIVQPADDITSVEMPSVARSNDLRWILAARVTKDAGEALAIFVAREPTGPFMRHGGVLEIETLRSGVGGSAFDADEIASPSLRVVDGAYHLYFAGRHGTRWGIGVRTSAELVYWRPVTRRHALLAGDGSGFDALGVRDPDVLVEDGLTQLFFVGGDGETEGLGSAQRPRPVFSP